MKQVFQSRKTGKGEIVEVPVPSIKEGHLLIETTKSLISLGTERMLVEFGRSGWINKVKQNPDKVKQVFQKVKTDGLAPVLNAVFNKLGQPAPLGYCNVGIVREVGKGVSDFRVGDRVASNGYHAEVVCVPENLCAKVPETVDDITASFAVLSSIALQGIRLIGPTLGESVVVIGLGLIGLLAVQILQANGCRVLGFDLDEKKIELARQLGVEAYVIREGMDPVDKAIAFSKGYGVDAVLITAATKSNAPITQAPKMCRRRGRVVLIGVVGLELSRADFYKKEISFQVSCSYGPGRYEKNYEKKGLDYPIGYVRWTENRNFETVLELMAAGKIKTDKLITNIIPIGDAGRAYELVSSQREVLGIILDYPEAVDLNRKIVNLNVPARPKAQPDEPVIGFIGAGSFTSITLAPQFKKCKHRLKTIASSTGVSSLEVGRKYGFESNTTDYQRVLNDPDVNTVIITTRHNTHTCFVVEALRAGKHVFVEKPLCLDEGELKEVISVYSSLIKPPLLTVGYNRRFSPCAAFIKKVVSERKNPLCATFTVNAGFIPLDHWTQDPKIGGGRIIGEACHFIDFLRFIVGAALVEVRAVSTAGHSGTDSDKTSILLTFKDGSIGTLNYFANGSNAYAKERAELFCDGKTVILDNFRSVKVYGSRKNPHLKLRSQDKGHANEVKEFLAAIKQGQSCPIPFDEITEVALASILAVESAKNGNAINIIDRMKKILM